MAIQPIRLFGDPVLRTPATPVVDFDEELRRLVEDLTDTMLDAPGAGLAAPQIGVGLRVFTWHVDGELGHLVNPTLTLSEETQDGEEGCLSIPGLTFDCKRALRGGGPRLRHARRAGDDRGLRAARPGDPARDRPPRRGAVRRPARPRDPQGGDEGDPGGGLVRRTTRRQGLAAPDRTGSGL